MSPHRRPPGARSALLVLAIPLLSACGATATPFATATAALPTLVPTARVTPEPTLPPNTSIPAETPSPEEAYQQLIASIPAEIATRCAATPRSQVFEPGQLAQADCNLPAGALANYVTYKAFDGPSSMNAFFDIQRKAHERGGRTTGPGCGRGPGEGTWDAGRKDCYLFSSRDAQVMWTHDVLFVEANALRADGDFAKLELFWQTAGPVTP